jgi:Sulfotransferase family
MPAYLAIDSLCAMGTPAASSANGSTRAPDFFIVGSPKTGTTALYEMLVQHPQIYMPEVKEPLFLASDVSPRAAFANERREAPYPRTLESYLALFADATPEQRVGEASTFYLWSDTAAQRIADLQPRARIIAILREPASFLRSLHLMLLGWGVENESDLRQAISLADSRREGANLPPRSHRPQLLQYPDHVRYVDQLSRYDARFSADQMLVLIYEDFRRENDATVRKVLRFVGAADSAPIRMTTTNVTTSTVRSQRAKTLLDSIAKGRGPVTRSTRRTLKRILPAPVRGRSVRAFREHVVNAQAPPPDDELMLELRRRFKPEVLALSAYLDRDLMSLWGYDQVE